MAWQQKMTAALAVAVVLVATAAENDAKAEMSEAEAKALFQTYHRAIESWKVCKEVTFGTSEHSAMASYIDERIEHNIGAARLNLMFQAQREARALIKQESCEFYDVRQLLVRFRMELLPLIDGDPSTEPQPYEKPTY